ncbi:AraC family transcriptional regulator [Paenibacillus sp. GD4]|jgi:AraC-like DNA-binding protein|uniref:helix-turn-helix transcriptional regulator n=1 Tax=Paenibacillus sp. GD4 TaxID=3068890 RepID=UPI0027968039|nr:AraC family transcriptional regulator [Paenibacillus sp. GD4]MDQ1909273.1 AraC family transcriptional regulator [Paenibacillus sp. GD4]
MTYPQTFDASIYPVLGSSTPLVVTRNVIHHHFPSHRHDVMEFSLVVGGEGTEWINGIPHRMLPGTATFIMPYQFHEISSTGSEPLTLLNCMFGLELLLSSPSSEQRQLVSDLMSTDSAEPYVLSLSKTESQTVETLFTELLREFRGTSKYRQSMLKLKLTEIVIHLERFRSRTALGQKGTSSAHDSLAQRLLVYLHQSFREELSLERLAEQFHVSRTYLSTILRQTTGKTFVELLHEIRLRHASSLLLSSDLAIADVTMEAGFQSVKTFHRVFKQYKGMTPKAYRETFRHGGAGQPG